MHRWSKDAWDEFVRATAPVIYTAVRRAIRARGRQPDEIADRVQDVYVRLLREDCRLLRTYDPDKAALSTWLTLIARTVVHEQSRKKILPTMTLNGQERAPSEPIQDAVSFDHPLPMSMLAEQQRRVIAMLFDEGLTVEHAAARLGVEEQTIRSAKHKALTRLREHLAETMGDPAIAQKFQCGERRGYSARPPSTTKENTDEGAP
jgi:RNA polymerase sigma-70 factor (ECF subfamily)